MGEVNESQKTRPDFSPRWCEQGKKVRKPDLIGRIREGKRARKSMRKKTFRKKNRKWKKGWRPRKEQDVGGNKEVPCPEGLKGILKKKLKGGERRKRHSLSYSI